MIVKVCGMRESENIRAVEALGVDLIGFIFYEKSKRFAGSEAGMYLPEKCGRVGVFVNAEPEQLESTVERFGLQYVQLHGSESPDYCRSLKGKVQIIKAFSISNAKDLERTKEYEGLASYFLFDTACTGFGGSGQSFDWTVLEQYHGNTPFLLSGGIGPDSIVALKNFKHPKWAGIDLNSKFELEPGMKDIASLKEFLYEQNQ